MSGLLRRLTRRRPATADENVPPTAASSEPTAAPAETPAEPGGPSPVPHSASAEPGHEQPTVALPATTEQPAVPLPAWSVAADQPTAFAAQPAPARDLPAGVDPHDLATAPLASARRGKLRRRLRYLRHVRELLLRDLGGFTYEIHRTAGGTAQEPQRRLSAAKAQRLATLDAEVLALESRLGEPHAEALLREPGIGGTCHECGELHASDAHFCSRCGAPLDEKARAQRAAEQPTTGSQAVAEPQPASVLWAGGPRPAPREEKEAPQPPSAVTSQWLASDQPTTFEPAPKADEPAAASQGWRAARPADEPSAAASADPAAKPADEPAAATSSEPSPEPADEPAAATSSEPSPEPADEPAAATPSEPAAATPSEPSPEPADEPAAAEQAADEPPTAALDSPATADPDQQDDTSPPAPATAAARAKPKRASKPRKPAKRPAKPRRAAPEPQTEGDEPRPTSDFAANGRRDEDVPPPMSSGDPLARPREQGS